MLTIDPARLIFQPGDIVLDLGSGEGRHTLGLYYGSLNEKQMPGVTLLAVDINHKDLITARSRLQDFAEAPDPSSTPDFIQGSGLQLPFPDDSIDHIICSEVLEHIDDYHQMLTEIRRVLKPHGYLSVSVPRAWPERICWALEEKYHKVTGGHVRIFNGHQLRREISRMGYQLLGEHGAHAIHVPYWWLRCLFWQRGENFWPVRQYHRFLIWDLFKAPRLTRWLDKLLNPVMGKSVVFYFQKVTQ